MVWGCFMFNGLGDLVPLPQNTAVTKEMYLELLMDNLRSSFQKTILSLEKASSAHLLSGKVRFF